MANLTRYVELAGPDPDILLTRARLAICLGKINQAEHDLNQLLALDPARATPRYLHAQLLDKLGRPAEAIADLDRLIGDFPLDSALIRIRGDLHARLQHTELAAADQACAAKLTTQDPNDLNSQAWRLITAPAAFRNHTRALELAQKAVELAPYDPMLLNILGVAQYGAGKFAEAVATLQTSLAAGDGKTDAFDLDFLAMAHERLGDHTQAHMLFNRAVAWHKAHPNLNLTWLRELSNFEAEGRQLLSGPIADLPPQRFRSLTPSGQVSLATSSPPPCCSSSTGMV